LIIAYITFTDLKKNLKKLTTNKDYC